ncbi:acetyl-CoA synthetase-like protein [Acephala macrosclerotiorum]|nr:acetyl-CoA synthetase-like protein [Acephala macrosclerotiorum]
MAPLPSGSQLKTAIVQPGMFHKGPFSTEISSVEKVEGETIPRRNAKYVDGLLSRPRPDIHTLYDVLIYARDAYGDAHAMGWRQLIEMHEEIKSAKRKVNGVEQIVEKKWRFYEMSKYKYLSYKDYFQRAVEIGQAFRKAGLEPGDRVHIFAATSMKWLAISHGAATQSMPIVTSYATLGIAGLEHSLVQTKAKAIFVDADLLSKLEQALTGAPDLKLVIYNDENEIKQGDVDSIRKLYPNLSILSFAGFLENGLVEPVDLVPPKPDDLCCIMYTSGTTGTPKGVPLTHRNVVAAIAGLDSIFKHYVGSQDSVLSYLPLAHSFEYAFENTCLYWGMKMGYGNPRTLLDTSMRKCKGDIKEFRPTIMVGVPTVWDLVRKGIEDQVAKKNWFTRKIFPYALRLKMWLCEKKYPGVELLDKIVFKAVKDQFGGRLRACFNGAGLLGKETRRFISYTVAPLIIGYGLTETTAMGALQDPLEWTDNTLGDVPASIEIKLVDFAERNFFAKDNRGEIWIRGDPVMTGYYENEEETEKAMAPGGWFKTGDIGAWADNGHLMILDRKKNLVKVKNGEYVALEKLESIYRGSNVVSNCCVYATGEQSSIVVIVVPRHEVLLQLANKHVDENLRAPLKGIAYNELLGNPVASKLVLDQLCAEAKKASLPGFETPTAVILSHREWTTENDLLTPAQKLQRRKIYPLYADKIEAAYQ